MKLVRILIYEDTEDNIREHMKQCFVGPDRPFEKKGNMRIQEIFRGTMSDDLVEHLAVETLSRSSGRLPESYVTELSADEMDKDVVVPT